MDAGPGITLAPLVPADHEALRAIHAEPSVALRWADSGGDDWLVDGDEVRFTIRVDGEIAGLVQYGEETDPFYRHAWLDLFISEAFQSRGVGTAVLTRLAHHLFEDRGHHRLTIDPAADNAPAIRCYEKVGFKPVGVMRQAERDADGAGWHDALLMDLVRDEFSSRGGGR